MIVKSTSTEHNWPLSFGKIYFVLNYLKIGDGYIYYVKDDKLEIKPYHSNLFQRIL